MNYTTFALGLVIFAFGACVGSFLNVIILRLPEGESIVTGPSHCTACGKRLMPYELIPIISWLFLGGRCSGCKARISAQYPLIEAACGVLWVVSYAVMGLSLKMALACLMTSALLALSVIDGRTLEIPVGINVFILVLGAAATALDYTGWASHLIGAVCVSVPLLVIRVASGGRGIGGGDVKLMAACGLFLGWRLILLAFGLGCILGAIIHLVRMRAAGAERVLAMGPYLSAGVTIALFFGERLLNAYFSAIL